MKGAFLLSERSRFFDEVTAVLVRQGGRAAAGTVQVEDESGRLFSVYETTDPELDWEFRDGPFTLAGRAVLPDMSVVNACSVECRFEDLFVTTVARIDSEVAGTVWVLDGDGVVWLASEVDPRLVRL